ncbi:hypothetical protein K435DRAFT_790040 [Dendrothele bispora CBS 962.96]|uniref:Uncharacterized protein n=1 Tax=Dendrothele bispora (strain CBS 962.96) TaxID=1314807 RepID=A0A4S8MTR6_DENBC|nr:hypothetical protein K435DRAFT_790040 [Dendrothele bispora CBS 962.96]
MGPGTIEPVLPSASRPPPPRPPPTHNDEGTNLLGQTAQDERPKSSVSAHSNISSTSTARDRKAETKARIEMLAVRMQEGEKKREDMKKLLEERKREDADLAAWMREEAELQAELERAKRELAEEEGRRQHQDLFDRAASARAATSTPIKHGPRPPPSPLKRPSSARPLPGVPLAPPFAKGKAPQENPIPKPSEEPASKDQHSQPRPLPKPEVQESVHGPTDPGKAADLESVLALWREERRKKIRELGMLEGLRRYQMTRDNQSLIRNDATILVYRDPQSDQYYVQDKEDPTIWCYLPHLNDPEYAPLKEAYPMITKANWKERLLGQAGQHTPIMAPQLRQAPSLPPAPHEAGHETGYNPAGKGHRVYTRAPQEPNQNQVPMPTRTQLTQQSQQKTNVGPGEPNRDTPPHMPSGRNREDTAVPQSDPIPTQQPVQQETNWFQSPMDTNGKLSDFYSGPTGFHKVSPGSGC